MSDYILTSNQVFNLDKYLTSSNIKAKVNSNFSNSIFSEKILNCISSDISDYKVKNYKEENIIDEKYFISLIEEIDTLKDSIKEQYDFNPPNKNVIEFSKIFIKNLIKNKIQPYRITPSSEEGICFMFKKENKILYFEIYNDDDMGYIIEDEKNKKIIENKNVQSENEILKVLLNFK
ncbi:MAG TPA: hypothetical protein PK385_06435 [Spirochaetota bacterium]|nr:hypothetical protein [Spirochaetota bacterium]HOS32268.1 hypothetical protein [Spirochaetota bacterium]HOS55679.1 hypothetical protein [Spirochaetota bacterium]HPK61365.1 hypothetical protein [Spirochaetota bacterium]HQF78072.1 hypothetical protein [Spirochaetota bacterium]